MKKILFVTSFSILGLSVGSVAQSFSKEILTKATAYTKEVQLECPQYQTEEHILLNAEVISRTEILTKAFSKKENYPLLSSVALKSKCNTALSRDEANFDPNNFNVLKYFMNWYPKEDMIYRVDKTNYLIVIHPQK